MRRKEEEKKKQYEEEAVDDVKTLSFNQLDYQKTDRESWKLVDTRHDDFIHRATLGRLRWEINQSIEIRSIAFDFPVSRQSTGWSTFFRLLQRILPYQCVYIASDFLHGRLFDKYFRRFLRAPSSCVTIALDRWEAGRKSNPKWRKSPSAPEEKKTLA